MASYGYDPMLTSWFDCRYDRKSEAAQAVTEMHGFVPEGCLEPLTVKIAEEHGKQKAAYYAGWHAGYTQSRGKSSHSQYNSIRYNRYYYNYYPAYIS